MTFVTRLNCFIAYARSQPLERYWVTRIGCGLAGYKDSEVAPMFKTAPENCSFANEWKSYISVQAPWDELS